MSQTTQYRVTDRSNYAYKMLSITSSKAHENTHIPKHVVQLQTRQCYPNTSCTSWLINVNIIRTLAVKLTRRSHADTWHTAKANVQEKFDFWPFDLRLNARRGPAMDYRSTKFVVDSSSHFSSRAWTDRPTVKTKCSIPRPQLYSQHGIITFTKTQSTISNTKHWYHSIVPSHMLKIKCNSQLVCKLVRVQHSQSARQLKCGRHGIVTPSAISDDLRWPANNCH